MLSRHLRHRAPTLWLLLPFMGGIVVGEQVLTALPVGWLLTVAALAAGIALVSSAQSWVGMPAFCASIFLTGTAYYELRCPHLAVWDHLPPREASLTLSINRVFASPNTQSVSGLARVVAVDKTAAELKDQRVYFSVRQKAGAKRPIRSTEIEVTGVLSALALGPQAGTFDDYLAKAGVNFKLGRGRLLRVSKPPSRYRVFCERAAERFMAILGRGVESKRPALTAIYRAMMLGFKRELSDEQDALFIHSGTMHLFAINGLHIGVVAVALHALLGLARCPRVAAALVVLAVLWLDVDTTGASPSAVRAFLLIACFEVAYILRVPSNPLSALSASALIVLIADPMTLFSASFQMSYGVVLGILSFGLPLAECLHNAWRPFKLLPEITWKWWQHSLARAAEWLASALGIGLAATLVSSISGVEFFHTFAPSGFMANLILVPLAGLVIVAGFVSIAAGSLGASFVSVLFNHAAVVVLFVIDGLIRTQLRVPHLWWTAQWRAAWIGPVSLAVLSGVFVIGYALAWRRDYGGFWPPFVAVVLTLAAGVRLG